MSRASVSSGARCLGLLWGQVHFACFYLSPSFDYGNSKEIFAREVMSVDELDINTHCIRSL